MKEFERFEEQQITNVYAIRGGGSCGDCADKDSDRGRGQDEE